MMKRGLIYFIVQFVCIGLILLDAGLLSNYSIGVSFQAIGVIVAGLAIVEMQKSILNITPEPRKNATLITSGIYKYIRHPMYLSILCFLFPLVMNKLNYTVWVYIILTSCLLLKLNYEEAFLIKKFPNYELYKKSSKKLIPFIY